MAIPTLSIELVYKPGTAVAFSGRLLQHGSMLLKETGIV